MNPSEWELLPKVLGLLRPILEASKDGESNNAGISDMIPSFKQVVKCLEAVTEEDLKGVKSLRDALVEQMKR